MMATTATATLPSAIPHRHNPSSSSSPSSLLPSNKSRPAISISTFRRSFVSCEVGLKPSNSSSPSTSSSLQEQQEPDDAASARIGARVKVTAPLKVYHVSKIPEMDLTGMEGELKQYVGVFKGKKISANLPYKVEFVKEVEGRGPVKFVAHLREDEFEYVD